MIVSPKYLFSAGTVGFLLLSLLVGTIPRSTFADGSLVWGFTVSVDIFEGQYGHRARGVAVGSSGVYIVGYDTETGNQQWRMERRDLNTGALLQRVRVNNSSGDDYATAVTVDSGGVYVVGRENDASMGQSYGSIKKRDPLDLSMQIWGGVAAMLTYNGELNGVAVDSTDVYAVGFVKNGGFVNGVGYTNDKGWFIQKRDKTTGVVAWTVPVNTTNMSTSDDVATSVAVDSTGVYVAGWDAMLGSSDVRWRVEKRSLLDGSLIWSITPNPSTGNDYIQSISTDGSGSIYIAGNNEGTTWLIEKRNASDGGFVWIVPSTYPTSGINTPYGTAIDSAGGTGVYAVGGEWSPGNYEWRMQRIDWDGTSPWSVPSNPSTGYDSAMAVAVDSTGVYVAGSVADVSGYGAWRIEKRVKGSGGSPLPPPPPPPPPPSSIDCGLRFKGAAASVIIVACEPAGTLTSALRIRKGTTTYGIVLVDITDSNASPLRIRTSAGVKALRRF